MSFSGRRGNEPVGHLTQLLWPETTHLGCATVYSAIKQPPNTGKLIGREPSNHFFYFILKIFHFFLN